METAEEMKIDFRLFIFPPWHVARILFYRNDSESSIVARIYFFCWICAQWLLLFFSGNNILVNLIIANSALTVFLVTNPLVYIKLNDLPAYLPQGQKHGYIVSLLIAFTVILLMYGVVDIPQGILMGWRRVDMNLISYDFHWTGTHIFAARLLLLAWIAFTVVDRHALFSNFPKYNFFKETTSEEAKNSITVYVILLYLIAVIFSATRIGKFLLFE